MMMFSSALNVALDGGIHDQPAAGQSFAEIIVGVAFQRHA